MDTVNVIPSIIKFISKIQVLVSVVLSSGLLVCLPSWVMAKMQLSSLRRNFGWLVSLVFIVSASWLLIRFTIWLFKVLRKLQEQVSHPMARHREMNCYL